MPARLNSSDHKLIGKDYPTPDLVAKVTGRAKYAEDYRVDGMLFARLLLSPYPHARVRSIDTSAALAMPGVKAILTADDLPAPADSLTDNGTVIKANKLGDQGLTNEPVYQGEPILAVVAVDELTAVEAIERIRIDYERLPYVVDPLETLKPGSPNPRMEGNVWVRPPAPPTAPGTTAIRAPAPTIQELKWTEADFADATRRQAADGQGHRRVGLRRHRCRLQECGVHDGPHLRDAQHQSHLPGNAHGDGLLAERESLRIYRHAKHRANGPCDRSLAGSYSRQGGAHQRIYRRRFWQQRNGGDFADHSGAARQESQCAGDDAHQPRGRILHWPGASRDAGPDENRLLKEGRITGLDMFVICDNGAYDAGRRRRLGGTNRVVAVSTAGHALARLDGADEHAAARSPERSRRHAGHHHHGDGAGASRAQSWGSIRWSCGESMHRPARRPSDLPPQAGSCRIAPVRLSRKRSTAARSCSAGRNGRRCPSEAEPWRAAWAFR